LIPFNIPYYSGNELSFISKAIEQKNLTGDLEIMHSCESFLELRYKFPKIFLTSSCTIALEMAAVLVDIQPGDEVIVPSYSFVSTVNAFVLRGAKIIFADSRKDHPNLDENEIEKLITSKTKAIVVIHYGGVALNMDMIMNIAKKNNLTVIEDAAQCIDSFYKERALGTIGDIGCFSFHETKNIHCGEGGFISVNNPKMLKRAEIIRNKGTNRPAFLKGEALKYEWMDIGFSTIPSALTVSFLASQLEKIDEVQKQRAFLWNRYYELLTNLKSKNVYLPLIPVYSRQNFHTFYLVCNNESERDDLINFLKMHNIQSVFHYQSLNSSPFYKEAGGSKKMYNAEKFTTSLIRLPLYYSLTTKEVDYICEKVLEYYSL
jgi:dTDP-4-amino-4,6-dideoxygalactose transaminase